MSDNPDTIDTILDDMLNDGHTGPADSLEWVQAKMKFYAGRIKEAWKRQCSQRVSAAAMREALEKCRALAETIWQSEGGEDVSAEIAELKDRINAALSAPPRNCDRFATWEETLSAFRAETENRKPLELWLKSEIQAFAIWHFALATEQKGASNGSK